MKSVHEENPKKQVRDLLCPSCCKTFDFTKQRNATVSKSGDFLYYSCICPYCGHPINGLRAKQH